MTVDARIASVGGQAAVQGDGAEVASVGGQAAVVKPTARIASVGGQAALLRVPPLDLQPPLRIRRAGDWVWPLPVAVSPDGTPWAITVDDTGALSAVKWTDYTGEE